MVLEERRLDEYHVELAADHVEERARTRRRRQARLDVHGPARQVGASDEVVFELDELAQLGILFEAVAQARIAYEVLGALARVHEVLIVVVLGALDVLFVAEQIVVVVVDELVELGLVCRLRRLGRRLAQLADQTRLVRLDELLDLFEQAALVALILHQYQVDGVLFFLELPLLFWFLIFECHIYKVVANANMQIRREEKRREPLC